MAPYAGAPRAMARVYSLWRKSVIDDDRRLQTGSFGNEGGERAVA
jgi:hypothetical protein